MTSRTEHVDQDLGSEVRLHVLEANDAHLGVRRGDGDR